MVKVTQRLGGLVLRFAAFCAALGAVIAMVTSRERSSFFVLSLVAKGFFFACLNSVCTGMIYVMHSCVYGRYFVIANAIVSVYSFLVLFLPKESLLWKFVVVLDLMVTMLLTSSLSAAVAAGASQTLPRGNGCHVCFALPWLHPTTGLFREHVPLFRLLFPPFQKYITKGYVSEEEAGKRLAQVVSDPSLGKSGVYWSWNNNSSSFENQLSKEASDAEKAKTVGG